MCALATVHKLQVSNMIVKLQKWLPNPRWKGQGGSATPQAVAAYRYWTSPNV